MKVVVDYVTYQLLPGLFPDAGGGGGEVDAGEELVAGRTGERGDEVVEAQKLGCTQRKRQSKTELYVVSECVCTYVVCIVLGAYR